jgi:L-ascorbate metabolism protein UlaG (beta-lactamase superfamily)
MSLNTKLIILIIVLLLLLFVLLSPVSAKEKLDSGKCIIWYLGHSGWAVKTAEHFLVFDYWEWDDKAEGAGLSDGFIHHPDLKDQDVYVFVSHAHGDHFDETILDWSQSIERITYVFGWKAFEDPSHIYLTKPREKKRFGDFEVLTINHEFDNIPEVAFLVKVDGLVIFHSGDHGTVGEKMNPIFRDNIDYLAENTDGVDIAFISIFGSNYGDSVNKGDLYTIESLEPKVTFPMHCGRREHEYKEFASEARKKNIQTQIICAEARGGRFYYGDGGIE